jgi:soluble lytic murein transglycosylase
MIPFDETRNYVMRVAEALPVYRARIQGAPAPLVPTWDLTGGGLKPAPEAPRIRLASSARPMLGPRAIAYFATGGVLVEALRPAPARPAPVEAPVDQAQVDEPLSDQAPIDQVPADQAGAVTSVPPARADASATR